MKSHLTKLTFAALFVLAFGQTFGQQIDSLSSLNNNFRNTLYTSKFGIAQVGGYAQIDYNQPISPTESLNRKLDVHRLVLFVGHKFSDRLNFITEIEIEHVKEIYIEQAMIEYKLTDWMNLRAGLMLIPMGIVNEYHEPPSYNGVERPNLDKYIVPTTWRELGVGVNGRFPDASISYQAYVLNGFKSAEADGEGGVSGVLRGTNGLRGGRQKGIRSTINSPTFSTKIDYYGIPGLRLGVSGYFGNTQPEDEVDAIDGATVGVSMVGLDARYAFQKFTARGWSFCRQLLLISNPLFVLFP